MASKARREAVEEEIADRVETDGEVSTKAAIGDPTGDPLYIDGIGGGNPRGAGWGDGKVWSTFLHGLLDAIDAPPGVVLPYIGSIPALPIGWQAADGTNGTPNLTGYLLRGAASPGGTGNITEGAGPGTVPYYEVVWIIRVATP